MRACFAFIAWSFVPGALLALAPLARPPVLPQDQDPGRDPVPSPEESSRATIRGQLSTSAGEPAAGVVLTLEGRAMSTTSSEPARSWTDLSGLSDEEGRFELRFQPPDRTFFTLYLEFPGSVTESWRWSSIGPGEVVEMGAWELAAEGGVEGRVLLADGRPILEHWRVWASAADTSLPRRGGAYLQRTRPSFEATGLDGHFTLDGLPAGPCRLWVELDAAGRVEGPEVEVVGGERVAADIEFDGPDLDLRIHVDLTTRPIHPAVPRLENVRLQGEDGRVRTPTVSERMRRGVDFDGLDPEQRYQLEIDDPFFEPVLLRGLRAGGEPTRVSLVGNSALRLFVDDGYSGDVVENYDAHLRLFDDCFPADQDPWLMLQQFEQSGSQSALTRVGSVLIHSGRDEPLVRSTVFGLVAGGYTLMVTSPGRAKAFLPLEGLRPGEMREVRVELFEGGTLAGTVLESDGRVRPGTRLTLFHPGFELAQPLGRVYLRGEPHPSQLGQGYELARVSVDSKGGFQLPPVAPGTYVLRARASDSRETLVEVEVVDRERTELELVLPEPAPRR